MSLIKSASTVSLLTLASRVTGLVRDLLIAATFGASAMTDAFYVAFRIPNMFRRLFAEGAFSQAFVPVLGQTRTQQGDVATKALVDQVATVLVWALTLTCAVGVAGAAGLVWLTASGLQQRPGSFEAAVLMTRWMFPYLGLISLAGMAGGVLNTWRRFAVPAASPVLLNLCMIGATWLGAPWLAGHGVEPIYALAAGVMLGGILQLAAQLPSLRRLGMLPQVGLRWRALRAAWRDPATQAVARLMVPSLLGVGVAQISLLINTQIASHLATGSVTWITNSDRLMEFPTAMLGVALGVVLMPRLSAAQARGDTQDYSNMLDMGLRLVLLMTVPCAVALLTFAQPLVATLFHYGKYQIHDVQATAQALTSYGVGLLGLVAIKVLAPGYYARQDTRTPVRIAVVVLVLTQIFNIILVPFLQHAALTLSISLGALINAAWLLLGLRRNGAYQPKAGWLVFTLRVLAATAALGVYLAWANHLHWIELAGPRKWERILQMAWVLAGSALVYFGALWALGLRLKRVLGR